VQVFGRVARRAARSSGDGSQRRGRAKNRDVAPLASGGGRRSGKHCEAVARTPAARSLVYRAATSGSNQIQF